MSWCLSYCIFANNALGRSLRNAQFIWLDQIQFYIVMKLRSEDNAPIYWHTGCMLNCHEISVCFFDRFHCRAFTRMARTRILVVCTPTWSPQIVTNCLWNVSCELWKKGQRCARWEKSLHRSRVTLTVCSFLVCINWAKTIYSYLQINP